MKKLLLSLLFLSLPFNICSGSQQLKNDSLVRDVESSICCCPSARSCEKDECVGYIETKRGSSIFSKWMNKVSNPGHYRSFIAGLIVGYATNQLYHNYFPRI